FRAHQHDPGKDPAGLRRPRQGARRDGRGRRRLRGHAREDHGRRRRHRRARRAAAARGRRCVRRVLEPADAAHRRQGAGAGRSPLSTDAMATTQADAPVRLTRRPQWAALRTHAEAIAGAHLRELFAADPARGQRLGAEGAGLYLDYSKQRVDEDALRLLLELAEACGLSARTAAMFAGARINRTEDRPVLHVALRMPKGGRLEVDGVDVVAQVHAVLDRMAAFSDRVRNGAWTGHSGKRMRNVISIGIGGSDLGPVMAYEALRDFSDRDMHFGFVSNVDGTDF